MLSFIPSIQAYLKRLFMAFLMLPCLVVAEQAQQPLVQDSAAEAGMSVAEHYTLSGDSLRLRHSRELDLNSSPTAPDLSFINAQEWVLNLPLASSLATHFITLVIVTSTHNYALARAPPTLHT